MKVLCCVQFAFWFGCVLGDDHEYKMSVEEKHSDSFTDAAAAATNDGDNYDDNDDNEYFEDVHSSVPSLSELRRQIIGEIGESLFNRVLCVVQVL